MLKNKTGIQLALMTMVISGVSVFVNKYGVGLISPPVLYTGLKNVFVGLAVVAVLLAAGKWKLLLKLSGKQWLGMLAVGVVGGFLPFYLFFTGLSMVSAPVAQIIHKSLVFWVALLALPLLKERLSMLGLAGIMALFYANVMIGGFSGFAFSTGEMMILAATWLWAVETVLVKRLLPTFDVDVLLFARMGIGSLLLMLTAFWQSPASLAGILTFSLSQWAVLAVVSLALFGYVSLWYRALALEKAIVVMALLVPSTLMTNLLNALFVTKTWNATGTAQLFWMILGSVLVLLAYRQSNQRAARNRLVQTDN